VDADTIVELFGAVGSVPGPVKVRRMFGGFGLFADGTMFGLAIGKVIYLKADQHTIPDFVREGLKPLTYTTRANKRVATSYWQMPDRLYDDPEELGQWAKRALDVARRAAERKAPGSLAKAFGRPKRAH
jgi:DNA transformation protein